jgi:hypothetical protein
MGFKVNANGTAVTDADIIVTVQEEIDAGNDITLSAALGSDTVTLKTKQTVVMDDKSTWGIDLGVYASYPVVSITLGGVNVGTDPSNLAIPASLVNDTTKHGNTQFVVTLQLPNTTKAATVPESYKMTLNIPALMVTKEIETVAEFISLIDYPEQAVKVTGYYRLANDIGDENFAHRKFKQQRACVARVVVVRMRKQKIVDVADLFCAQLHHQKIGFKVRTAINQHGKLARLQQNGISLPDGKHVNIKSVGGIPSAVRRKRKNNLPNHADDENEE